MSATGFSNFPSAKSAVVISEFPDVPICCRPGDHDAASRASMPFGGGGQVGLDDREVGESLQDAPAAAGGALRDFDGPYSALGFVTGEPTVRSVASRRIMSWWPRNRRPAAARPCGLAALALVTPGAGLGELPVVQAGEPHASIQSRITHVAIHLTRKPVSCLLDVCSDVPVPFDSVRYKAAPE
jgi:hypothetical protein